MKSSSPFISICIPAFSNVLLLQRLLDSITAQTFSDFEVIVTDDSPGVEVEDICMQYKDKFSLSYYRNHPALGTPENWNAGIAMARGEWIKLMHHDDWFAMDSSLQQFVDAAKANPEVSFIFSAYRNVYEDNSTSKDILLNESDKRKFQQEPIHFMVKNFIGPPSVVMHRNNKELVYDKALKWLVDTDFYIRHPGITTAHYISVPLVCVGVHARQVTRASFGNRSVEVPEYFYQLSKFGIGILRHVMVFDAYWRLIRNFNIRSGTDLREAGYVQGIPTIIGKMMVYQRPFPRWLLRIGLFSKLCMFVCYLRNPVKKAPAS